jgi:hypothetical protein
MKRLILICICLLLTAAPLFAAKQLFQAASIVSIQQKTNTRVLYYIVNTPITKDEPYYEISVQLKDVVYLGRYIPRHADETLPDEWTPGAAVEARVEGRRLYLKRPSGSELQLAVIKQTAAASVKSSPEVAPAGK